MPKNVQNTIKKYAKEKKKGLKGDQTGINDPMVTVAMCTMEIRGRQISEKNHFRVPFSFFFHLAFVIF